MIVPRDILGDRINFYIGATAIAEEGGRARRGQLQFSFLWDRIGDMQAALERAPKRHLDILMEVPIIIWNGSGRGGWVPPDRSSRWLSPDTERRFGVNGVEVAGLPHANGVITITTNVLDDRPQRDTRPCMWTILHEAGHCIDHHLGLTSPGSPSYRNGNRAYQGQRYGRQNQEGETVYDYIGHEFKAETYSRLFMAPGHICRRQNAAPMCVNPGRNHSYCNERLQRDLARSPAFQALGSDVRTYLPLASVLSGERESEGPVASARGPIGQQPTATSSSTNLAPNSTGRTPGPEGVA